MLFLAICAQVSSDTTVPSKRAPTPSLCLRHARSGASDRKGGAKEAPGVLSEIHLSTSVGQVLGLPGVNAQSRVRDRALAREASLRSTRIDRTSFLKAATALAVVFRGGRPRLREAYRGPGRTVKHWYEKWLLCLSAMGALFSTMVPVSIKRTPSYKAP